MNRITAILGGAVVATGAMLAVLLGANQPVPAATPAPATPAAVSVGETLADCAVHMDPVCADRVSQRSASARP
jgi:hypothetical protein